MNETHDSHLKYTRSKVLACFEKLQGEFYLDRFYIQSEEHEPLWYVVQSSELEDVPGYILSEGDIIKLGRIKLIVKKLQSNTYDLTNSHHTAPNLIVATEPRECKICYEDSNTTKNPLITPCNCSGTTKYIHLECLKKCMESKKQSKSRDRIYSSTWSNLHCEVCTSPLPIFLNFNSTKINLLESESVEHDGMIMLECIDSVNERFNKVHMILVSEGSVIKLGRGHECDARVADISVSRFHANVTYINGQFILKDNKSKFGTLVQIKDTIELNPCEDMVLQCGRTLLKIKIQKCDELEESAVQNIDEDQATSVPEGSPQW